MIKLINEIRHTFGRAEPMNKKTWSTRLDEETEKKVRNLIEKTGLKEAEVLRRLIIIGLKNVKEPADLLVI